MLTKSRVLSTISKFPDHFSLDELVEKMILIEKIEQGIQQSDKGQVTPEDEFDKEINSWFK